MGFRNLDFSIIEELKGLSDTEHPFFFCEQVMRFSQRGRQLVEDLDRGVLADDPERVKSVAHLLAGSSATIGAARLSSLCIDLELHCTHWRRGHARMLHDAICQEFDAAERMLLSEAAETSEGKQQPA